MGPMSKRFIPVLAIAMMTSGCASAGGGGGNQLENTVYATHRLVQNLDKNMGSSVTKLNETTAELLARIESSDRETKQMMSIVQENQGKLETLQRRLDELTATLYRQFNLSPPSGVSGPSPTAPPRTVDVNPGGITVQPPQGTPQAVAQPGETASIETLPAPAGEPALVTAPAVNPDEQYQKAQGLYANGDYPGAVQAFDAYLKQFSATKNGGNAQYWKAHSYFKMEEYDKAISEFTVLRTSYPDSVKLPIAMNNQAVAYSRMGETQSAVALFKELIQKFPDDPATLQAQESLRKLQGQN